ncbi:MAG: RnfABCDGE type electron transport complex subunit D, partial [Cycloclasticus sp.]
MHFLTSSSPFIPPSNSVQRMMLWVLIALLPGCITMIWQFGYGVLFNIIICLSTAVVAEAWMLKLRGRNIKPFISDLSAVVTALLLALALPTIAPWWLPFVGTLIAIVIAKHLYGGLGYNPFNPAMVAFAVLMVSFPKSMTVWVLPSSLLANDIGLADTAQLVFNSLSSSPIIDSMTAATPLDEMKTRLNLSQTTDEIRHAAIFSNIAGEGWQWVSLAYLAGGCLLIGKKVISWHIPVSLLAGLF